MGIVDAIYRTAHGGGASIDGDHLACKVDDEAMEIVEAGHWTVAWWIESLPVLREWVELEDGREFEAMSTRAYGELVAARGGDDADRPGIVLFDEEMLLAGKPHSYPGEGDWGGMLAD